LTAESHGRNERWKVRSLLPTFRVGGDNVLPPQPVTSVM
jgi:hypothetical protein